MNKKLNRVLDEIAKVEAKIAVWQEHLEELNIRKNQLEDAEIIKSVRAMKLGSREMLAFLEDIQNGAVPVGQGQSGMDAGQAEGISDGTDCRAPENVNGMGETADYGSPEKEPEETENNSGSEEVPAEKGDREDEGKD